MMSGLVWEQGAFCTSINSVEWRKVELWQHTEKN